MRNKKTIQRILSTFLSLAMLLPSAMVFAADEAETQPNIRSTNVSATAYVNDADDSGKIGAGDLATPSDWAKKYVSKADILGITEYFNVPWTQNINREQFCELAYNMLDHASKINWRTSSSSPFNDTINEKVIALYFEGIIEGKEDGVFAPDDLLTREEAAAVLDRIGTYSNLNYNEIYYIFDDADEISEWASDAIQRICNLNIMQGIGDNKFDPKGMYTVEQAVTTMVRMFGSISDDEFACLTFADKLNANMPEDKNYMFSPLSIKIALIMAANGASGKTQSEILDSANIKDLEACNKNIRLMLDKYSQSDILRLNVSNSIWINSDNTPQRFSNEYITKLSDNFDADADVVTGKNAVNKINGWVNDKTQEKIPTIISKDAADFFAMLINAVYFKGRWEREFSKGATKEDEFTSKDGSKANIDFMNKTEWMKYCGTDGVTIVELPYLTYENTFDELDAYAETNNPENIDISMYLMCSDSDFNPEETLTYAELSSEYIALSVPKFNIEYNTVLNDSLRKIGINEAFSSKAEFNKMFDSGNMWIDSAIHKTYISVDEEGTEAAAVTAVAMGGSGEQLFPEPIEIKYNKPFTFVIKDNINGEILFVGEYAFADTTV